MSETLNRIKNLVAVHDIRISEHGYDELANDRLTAREIVEDKEMTTRKKTKFIHEGKYVAEIDVEIIVTEDEWSPYLTLEDAYKLDDIREALRKGDLKAVVGKAKVYELRPVAV